MRGFFGLGTEHREVFLEHSFLLQYYLGMSYTETYNLPIRYRTWFIDRMVNEIKKSHVSKGVQGNDPGSREMRGMMRNQVPAKLRRFS